MRFSKRLSQEMPRDKSTARRQTGRTLGLAFNYIGIAMTQPEVVFKVKDHHHTYEADRSLLRVISGLIERLDLQFFEIDIVYRTIVYKPYEENVETQHDLDALIKQHQDIIAKLTSLKEKL